MRTAAIQYKSLTLASTIPVTVPWQTSDSESWKGRYHRKLSTLMNLKDRPVTGANKGESMTREETVEQMQQRHASGQNVFTGEQLEGKDLKDWNLLNRQREYSLGLIDGEIK